MKVAVIGAGYTGLSVCYYLSKKGFHVDVYEKEKIVGGLGSSFKEENWTWPLEKYYHHFFTSDKNGLSLAKELKVKINVYRPETKSLIGNQIYSLNSPFDVLRFTELNFFERLQMGVLLAFLKINPFWKILESFPIDKSLPKIMGQKAYQILWKPLFELKFGQYHNQIPLSWFWARIKKRSSRLGYPEKGFSFLAEKIMGASQKNKANFYLEKEVKKIEAKNSFFIIFNQQYDKVIYTAPLPNFPKIINNLPEDYLTLINQIKTLSSLVMIISLKKPFFSDNTYWLNICNKDFPFVSLVEHTNFIDKLYYGNEFLLYVGKYLPPDHPYFAMNENELLKIYDPYLKKINKNYAKNLIKIKIFKDLYAQPVITLNYSQLIPPFKSPVKNLYLATMHQVYPWDRGVNYAIGLGEKMAKIVADEK